MHIGAMESQGLLRRLKDKEDNFTERKLEAIPDRDIRKTLVAFANTLKEEQTAILFVGVDDIIGFVVGVQNTDKLQKRIRDVAEGDCYPPIPIAVRVLETEGKSVVAVVVEHSRKKPHFSGPAFVRRGSESVAATEELYNELIASRNSKTHKLLQWKSKRVTAFALGRPLDGKGRHDKSYRARHELIIERCDAHSLSVSDPASGRHYSIELERLSLSEDETTFDEGKPRLQLSISGTE